MTTRRIDEIVVGERHRRRDLGDIDALARSMADLGLLQPIVITPDDRLIAGHRRLASLPVRKLKGDAPEALDNENPASVGVGRFCRGRARHDRHRAIRRPLGEFTHVYREELERQKRPAPTERVMPVFAFFRRRDIELEVGLILAGKLIVDIPKTTNPKRRHQRLITEIVQRLTEGARSQQMPDDAIVYGWPGNQRPANAVDVDNDELMANWAKSRIVIEVRVDPRNDGKVRIDSDALRQMGIIKEH